MKPVPFKEANTVLGIPAEMADKVTPTRSLNQDGVCITKWKGTWKDRLRFLLFGTMWINVRGNGLPPLWITLVRPFGGK